MENPFFCGFGMSENIFVLYSPLINSLAAHRIPGWKLFSFRIFKTFAQQFSAFQCFSETCEDILIHIFEWGPLFPPLLPFLLFLGPLLYPWSSGFSNDMTWWGSFFHLLYWALSEPFQDGGSHSSVLEIFLITLHFLFSLLWNFY